MHWGNNTTRFTDGINEGHRPHLVRTGARQPSCWCICLPCRPHGHRAPLPPSWPGAPCNAVHEAGGLELTYPWPATAIEDPFDKPSNGQISAVRVTARIQKRWLSPYQSYFPSFQRIQYVWHLEKKATLMWQDDGADATQSFFLHFNSVSYLVPDHLYSSSTPPDYFQNFFSAFSWNFHCFLPFKTQNLPLFSCFINNFLLTLHVCLYLAHLCPIQVHVLIYFFSSPYQLHSEILGQHVFCNLIVKYLIKEFDLILPTDPFQLIPSNSGYSMILWSWNGWEFHLLTFARKQMQSSIQSVHTKDTLYTFCLTGLKIEISIIY